MKTTKIVLVKTLQDVLVQKAQTLVNRTKDKEKAQFEKAM